MVGLVGTARSGARMEAFNGRIIPAALGGLPCPLGWGLLGCHGCNGCNGWSRSGGPSPLCRVPTVLNLAVKIHPPQRSRWSPLPPTPFRSLSCQAAESSRESPDQHAVPEQRRIGSPGIGALGHARARGSREAHCPKIPSMFFVCHLGDLPDPVSCALRLVPCFRPRTQSAPVQAEVDLAQVCWSCLLDITDRVLLISMIPPSLFPSSPANRAGQALSRVGRRCLSRSSMRPARLLAARARLNSGIGESLSPCPNNPRPTAKMGPKSRASRQDGDSIASYHVLPLQPCNINSGTCQGNAPYFASPTRAGDGLVPSQ